MFRCLHDAVNVKINRFCGYTKFTNFHTPWTGIVSWQPGTELGCGPAMRKGERFALSPLLTRLLMHVKLFTEWRKYKGKGKALPWQAMQAQRGLGKLRLLDFLTTALYIGRLLASGTGRLYPQGYSWYSFSLGAESTPVPWFGRKEMCHLKNPVKPPVIDPGTFRLVAQLLNHYATQGRIVNCITCKFKWYLSWMPSTYHKELQLLTADFLWHTPITLNLQSVLYTIWFSIHCSL